MNKILSNLTLSIYNVVNFDSMGTISNNSFSYSSSYSLMV